MEFEDFRAKIESYLPIDFDNDENNQYRDYLLGALDENWNNERYQFCILATNMLFMSYLYKGFWFLLDKDIEKVNSMKKINQQLNQPNNMFALSIVNEQDFIEQYASVFDFHVNRKREFKNLIEIRDDCAHASGEIQYGIEDMPSKMQEYLKAFDKIFAKQKKEFINAFIKAYSNYLDTYFSFKTTYRFLKEFCTKEKVSKMELLEIAKLDIKDIISIGVDPEKIVSFYIIQYIVASQTNGEYRLTRLCSDIRDLCVKNHDLVENIAIDLENQQMESNYMLWDDEAMTGFIESLRTLNITPEMDFSDIPAVGGVS